MVYFFDLKKEKKNNFLIKNKGKYIFFIYNLSGSLNVEIESQDSQVYIFGIFIGKNRDNFELKTIQHHKVGFNLSNLLIKGIFFDQSRFLYEGLIRIEKEAQKSFAYQKNQNLILSPESFVDSRPFLEILNNDVFCTHGSTTGRLNEDQLYYLESRGLSRKRAALLLIEGFVGEVFEKMAELWDKSKTRLLYQKILKEIPKDFKNA